MKWIRSFILLFLLLIGCDSPNEPAKEGFTAKEAEQLASTTALEIWENPVLVGIHSPEDGGGVNRQGKLAKGENGKWLFEYYSYGFSNGLVIEVVATQARDFMIPADNLSSLQEILPHYIDSSEAMNVAEQHGGDELTDVKYILCQLRGDTIWPTDNPKKVAWEITYHKKNDSRVKFFIEAYEGIYLGRG